MSVPAIIGFAAAAVAGLLLAGLVALYIHDRWISKDNILRNFPVIGRFRYSLIEMGPKLRQYIVADNNEELPFNRDERDWIARSADGENNYFGFGTDDQLLAIGYPIIKHAVFPYGETSFAGSAHDLLHEVPSARTLGEQHNRPRAWKPSSIVNISAMSFGALGSHAIEALNRGAKLANCYHNTGEGGISPYHRQGADLIYQIGTGYFGCRDLDGKFSLEKLVANVSATPTVRGIEVKLSQGAKPGKGGVLPGHKVTEEIAKIRGVLAGQDCISPNSHSAFSDIDGLIRFVEQIAAATGLPVGIKSAVGHTAFWTDLARAMKSSGKGPDWITIDGGEGGTGAAPMVFTDHVSLPFRVAFPRVYRAFLQEEMADRVTWVASAKLGFPDRAIVAICLGADLINIARESMLSIGCIQAQRCHTGLCPTGVATNDPRLQDGLLPEHQAQRFARYLKSFRNELMAITHACGYQHPEEFTAEDVEISTGPAQFKTLRELEGYTPRRSKAKA
ncbi:MAG: FMN-binding glutamate synthase family protein [Planctomycetes bacterium]|nr:FMN-binding glutamate synthase family protein [Planctomycetota bacterium]